MMSRVCLSLLLISGLWAQTANNVFEKAPPDVDAALRERITKFYQAQTDKKYRQAEQYVAEESIDTFLGLNKATCISFKIGKVVYSENFTRASTTVFCSMYIPLGGLDKPVDMPLPDTWKLDNGQWFWNLDLSKGRATPFGHASLESKGAAGGAPMPKMMSLDSLEKAVQADKTNIVLSAKEAANESVRIANSLPGEVTLQLEAVSIPGVKVSLDRTTLKGGEQAKLMFESQPAPNRTPVVVRVIVGPLNTVIPIQVSFQ